VALKQGRAAAATVCGLDEPFAGTLGSWIIKLFDVTVASTGLSERAAREAGFEVLTALVPGFDRAHYLPTARRLVLKMVAEAGSGRLLGVQAVGPGDVAPRVDVAAAALTLGVDVDRLASVDLPYAPPFSLATDVILAAANVIRNRRDQMVVAIAPADLARRLAGERAPVVIDVRAPEEYDAQRLPGSRHLPLGALAGRLHELDPEEEIVTVCSIGIRSYQAALLLRARGFASVAMLDGGLYAWPYDLENV
jgi:rhodanese-related sulfurtransferase